MTDAFDVANPKQEFAENLESLLFKLSMTFGECEPTKLAHEKSKQLRSDENELDKMIGFWYLKMKKHLEKSANKDEEVIAYAGTFGVLDGIDFHEKYKLLDSEDKTEVWQLINNCNCFSIVHDEKLGDTPFKDIAKIAQKIAITFPKEKLKASSSLEIMKHIPNFLNDEEMHSIVLKLCSSDERMERVFGLLELEFKQKFTQQQKEIMTFTLRQASTSLADDATREKFLTITSAAPEIFNAAQNVFTNFMVSNPGIQNVASTLLDSTGLGSLLGMGGDDSSAEKSSTGDSSLEHASIDELERIVDRLAAGLKDPTSPSSK
jgi:hypothetical protein